MESFPDDAQDIITPVHVEHRVEFGDRHRGEATGPEAFGYWYDFLVYEFADGPARAEAVHYLDEAAVTLRHVEPANLTAGFIKNAPLGAFALRVLVFLKMRFDDIRVPADDSFALLDGELLARVEESFKAHLRRVKST